MADQTDLILKIWDALLTPDEPEGWRDATIIDPRWSLGESPNERELAVAGLVSGSGRVPRTAGCGPQRAAVRRRPAAFRGDAEFNLSAWVGRSAPLVGGGRPTCQAAGAGGGRLRELDGGHLRRRTLHRQVHLARSAAD